MTTAAAASLLEGIMIICFGLSWPLSIARSIKSKSTKGKSLLFMCFIAFGYVCGLVSKFMTHTYNLAFWFYFPNIVMVSTDICLYFRNKKIEASAETAE
ncbi:MAG TPA: hypothetical protein DCL73_07755 [Treponema sp.]|nr:hypothetical protein [Treponema sp.]